STRSCCGQTRTIADETVRKAMGMFVKDHIAVKIAVALHRSIAKNIHLHSSAVAVCSGRKVCIVRSARILCLARDPVIRSAAASKIVVLEISCLLSESEQVQRVVVTVVVIEKLCRRAHPQRRV